MLDKGCRDAEGAGNGAKLLLRVVSVKYKQR